MKIQLIEINEFHRDGLKRTAVHITIHNNGNTNSTAQNEHDWLENPKNRRYYGFHYVHDEKETIQCIPDDERAYHAGDGGEGEGNMKSIAHEICERGSRYFPLKFSKKYLLAESRCAKAVAKQIIDYGWKDEWEEVDEHGEMKRLKTHKTWNGKNCPRFTLKRWSIFKQLIRDYIEMETEDVSCEELIELKDYTNNELLEELKRRLK